MILQSLYELYDRLKDDTKYQVPPRGYSIQQISFKVVLRPDGTLFDIVSEKVDKRNRSITVPGEEKSSGPGFNPGFLWDNTGYMLGYKKDDSNPERTEKSFHMFKKLHLDREEIIDHEDFSVVCRFLENWNPAKGDEFPVLEEAVTGFGVFQILGKTSYVHDNEDIIKRIPGFEEILQDEDSIVLEQCLITGKKIFAVDVARLQPKIKGIGKKHGPLVSFKDPPYESYGKEQAYNAPVSTEAAYRYGAALNALSHGPKRRDHCLRLGDSSVFFWTERPSLVEDVFVQFATSGNNLEESQDESLRKKMAIFLQALKKGREAYSALQEDPSKTNFYLLGLAPNAARVAVRFFYQNKITDLLGNLRRHYEDMRVVPQFTKKAKKPDPEFPSFWSLLGETARESKEIPPVLSGPLLRAVITGVDYPQGLYSAVIRRIHADRRINYLRACIIKGFLVRNRKKEVEMALDIEKKDKGYREGRLFAVLERTQRDALGGNLNATIRDRYYSSASATPAVVFPRLLRLYQNHLGKLNPGNKINKEKLVQEILSSLENIPSHLNLTEQGFFALGYYHQTQNLWTKKEDRVENKNQEELDG